MSSLLKVHQKGRRISLAIIVSKGDGLDFWNGGPDVKQFFQTPNNQANFFKAPNTLPKMNFWVHQTPNNPAYSKFQT